MLAGCSQRRVDLLKGEPEVLQLLDQSEPLDRRLVEDAIPRCTTRCRRQEPQLLVVPYGVDPYPDEVGYLPIFRSGIPVTMT